MPNDHRATHAVMDHVSEGRGNHGAKAHLQTPLVSIRKPTTSQPCPTRTRDAGRGRRQPFRQDTSLDSPRRPPRKKKMHARTKM